MKRGLVAVVGLGLLVGALGMAFGFGHAAGRFRPDVGKVWGDRAMAIVVPWIGFCDEADRTTCGVRDVSDRRPVSCEPFAAAADARRAVLFAFGQSNSANFGATTHVSRDGVVNFNPHDGACYHAQDPLLGANGAGGSPWTRLGDQLLETGAFDRVLIVSFGIGGTPISRWVPGGDLHVRVEHAAAQLREAGIQPTHVLWHQGEADVGRRTPGSDYERMFGELLGSIRELGIEAPVYPAVATLCMNEGSDEIRSAQRNLPERFDGVRPGPDTDRLDRIRHRHDDCHFSAAGLEEHAALWAAALLGDEVARP